jgi:hypothetical protein
MNLPDRTPHRHRVDIVAELEAMNVQIDYAVMRIGAADLGDPRARRLRRRGHRRDVRE